MKCLTAGVFLLLSFFVACGGKVLYENAEGRGIGPEPAPSATVPDPAPTPGPFPSTEPEPPPKPPTSTVEDACNKLCDRDATCPTTLPAIPNAPGDPDDCVLRCRGKAQAKCGASDWLFCYADRISGCTALPPECLDAYCAWETCAKQPRSLYCR